MKMDRVADPGTLVSKDSPLWEVLKAAYGLGYHRIALPSKFGGLGLPPIGVHAVMEELGWGSAGIAISLMASAFPALAVIADGRPEIIREFVTPFAENHDASWIGCWALSEPRHGSDHFMVGSEEFRYPTESAQLVARADGQEYTLDGYKAAWVTNGGIATHALCSVAIAPSKSARGFVMIPLDLPGISRSAPTAKMGQREMNQGSIVFEGVKVPRRLMLKGEGYEQEVARLLAMTHCATAAIMTGVARAAYEEALEHSKRRRQGGARICDHQLVQKEMFSMFTKVEACRALSRATIGHNWATAHPSMESGIAAKTFCTRTAFEVANGAMQLFGADGFSTGNLVEKLFRDARVSLIEQGVNEALEVAAARRLVE
jgi:alkylation response protein AidB-like acyl-CoA dehydrogenase